MKKIAITTLTYEGKHYAFDEFLMHVRRLISPYGYEVHHIVCDNSPSRGYYRFLNQPKNGFRKILRYDPKGKGLHLVMAEAQNMLSQYVVANGYEFALNLESDVMIKPDTLVRLLAHNKPVVGAIYPQGAGRKHTFCMQDVDRNTRFRQPETLTPSFACMVSTGKLIRLHHIGIGCLLVRSDVLASTPFRPDLSKQTFPDSLFAEDLMMKNIPIYADTSILLRHNNQDWSKNAVEIS